MSDGETFVLIAASGVSVGAWFHWYRRLFKGFSPDCPVRWRWGLAAAPAVGVFLLIVGLRLWSATNVRNDAVYVALFTAVGAVTLIGVTWMTSALGLDPIADLLERRNPAVIVAISSVWMGFVALNIGSNIGEGDTIDTSLIPLFFNGLLYCGLIAAISAATGAVHAITAERSWEAAIRFGATAFSMSLPLAKASAGNWISMGATLIDSVKALPSALLLIALGWGLERWKPSAPGFSKMGTVAYGLIPAVVLVAVGAAMARFAGGSAG